MIQKRIIIIISLFTISITTLVVGTTKEIQGCIIGGILSIFGSSIITMGITMHTRYAVKTTKPRITKAPITTSTSNIKITIMPATDEIMTIATETAETAEIAEIAEIAETTETAVPPTDIKNPIYETV